MENEQLRQLKERGVYISVPHGVSMKPMLTDRDCAVEVRALDREPRRYDLVMYIRGESQGVIHRVIRPGDPCLILGDNCWQREWIPRERIAGIVTRFYRKGKWHSVEDKSYLLYVHLWTNLLFLRRPLFYFRDKVKGKLRRWKGRKL